MRESLNRTVFKSSLGRARSQDAAKPVPSIPDIGFADLCSFPMWSGTLFRRFPAGWRLLLRSRRQPSPADSTNHRRFDKTEVASAFWVVLALGASRVGRRHSALAILFGATAFMSHPTIECANFLDTMFLLPIHDVAPQCRFGQRGWTAMNRLRPSRLTSRSAGREPEFRTAARSSIADFTG